MTDTAAVWKSPGGHYIQLSADGHTGRGVGSPKAPLEPGWHYMTEAEFEAFVDQVVAGSLRGKTVGNVHFGRFGEKRGR